MGREVILSLVTDSSLARTLPVFSPSVSHGSPCDRKVTASLQTDPVQSLSSQLQHNKTSTLSEVSP